MCFGQCLGRREKGPSLCRWSLSPPSDPRSQPTENLGGEGPQLRGESLTSWQGGETAQTGDRDFLVQGRCREGGSRGIERKTGGISFDTQAGTVYGRTLVGAGGQQTSQEHSPHFPFSLEKGIECGGDCGVGDYGWWGDLKQHREEPLGDDESYM